MTWRPGPGARPVTPRIARLLASVAPEQKMIPLAAPPMSRATLTRAWSRDSRASAPRQWVAAGLPMPASRKGRITASTRGSTGANPA